MWRWVKIPKGIALIAFFLPWVTVSCSNRQIASATGWNLMSGRLTVVNPLTGAAQTETTHMSVALAIALIAIVLGLIVSFRGARPGATIVLGTSVVALLCIWLATREMTSDAIARRAAEKHGHIDAALAAILRIDWQIGYWLATIALVVAVLLALLVISGRSITVGIGNAPPDR